MFLSLILPNRHYNELYYRLHFRLNISIVNMAELSVAELLGKFHHIGTDIPNLFRCIH